MIVTSDIGDILYKDCKAIMGELGIKEIYQHPNEPIGEVKTERIVIHAPNADTPEATWDKSFANVNLVVPDKNGKKDITRLCTLHLVPSPTYRQKWMLTIKSLLHIL